MQCWINHCFVSLYIFSFSSYFIMCESAKNVILGRVVSLDTVDNCIMLKSLCVTRIVYLTWCLPNFWTSKCITDPKMTPTRITPDFHSLFKHPCCIVPMSMHLSCSGTAFPPCSINSYSSFASVIISSALCPDTLCPTLQMGAFILCTFPGSLQTTPSLP